MNRIIPLLVLLFMIMSCDPSIKQEREQLQKERLEFEQQQQAEAERKAAEKK